MYVEYEDARSSCVVSRKSDNGEMTSATITLVNTDVEQEQKTIPLDLVAQKVIFNTSSSNEGISLLAEAYIAEVVNSINDTNVSKQFIKLEDLIPQLEANKVLR